MHTFAENLRKYDRKTIGKYHSKKNVQRQSYRDSRTKASGKTTLLKMIIKSTEKKTLFWNCDEPDIRAKLTLPTSTELKSEIGNSEMILIDEAQRVKDIGITLKLLIDNFPEKQIIVTGSSALDLSNSINEPLTGRKFEYVMFPFTEKEIIDYQGLTTEKDFWNDD